MTMIFKPKNFVIQELVAPELHAARGERCWEMLDPGAVRALQVLRDNFGPCTVNNWHRPGGTFRLSGLRPFDSNIGAKYSQHKLGRAFDCKFQLATPAQVFEWIMRNRIAVPAITVLEDVNFTPTWLHFDTRPTNQTGIWVVKP